MAVTLTKTELQDAIGSTEAEAERLLFVCFDLIEQYAPDAPNSIANEAAIRTAGWLLERPPAVRREKTGDLETDYQGGTSPLRASGAMALLSPWKVRRGGAI